MFQVPINGRYTKLPHETNWSSFDVKRGDISLIICDWDHLEGCTQRVIVLIRGQLCLVYKDYAEKWKI